ncbi:potassium channel family protein [Deferrisoma camini]|uniref:potassium channel family protein n=1 Tax=Deferrisoma camini TaxID=1035120 RepID=UPI00046D64E9|nr:TrkA family potassium uptake protein [Deferrisoma camini]
MERRRFAVIGLGSFGFHLARYLYEMGHDVLAVDRNARAVDAVEPFCSRARVADASDKEDLEAAGVHNAEVAVVSLGTRIDSSILATLYLREFGVGEILVKAVSHDHARILERIGATEVIQPERDMAVQVAQRLAEPDVLDRLPFLEGYVLVEIRAPKGLWGRTLAESHLRRRWGLSVVQVRRWEAGKEQALFASPDLELRQGDVLVVLAKPEDVERFRKDHPGH